MNPLRRINGWLDGWSPWRLRRRLADMIDAYSALNDAREDAEADAGTWRRVSAHLAGRLAPDWLDDADYLRERLRSVDDRATGYVTGDVTPNHVTFDFVDKVVYEGQPWTPDRDPPHPPEDR